jgi:cbb3-type cytochrome oxidase subunit 3
MLAGIVTLAWMLAFIAVCAWAWRPSRKAGFEAAARLAVEDATPVDNDAAETGR